jgi:type IV pilus assembly protein PilA
MSSFNPDSQKGFTLVELMIVIAIVAILIAIAIPTYQYTKVKSYNATALSDVRNAYVAAQSYFATLQTDPITPDILKTNGFTQSELVTITINNGYQNTLSIDCKHLKGSLTYSVDSGGLVTSS